MTDPIVSVVIPTGPAHAEHARLAAASVAWQSLAPICETIISCDGGAVVPPLAGVTIIPSDGTRHGPAYTRNRALEAARGQFVVPLDADDYLLPRTIEHFLREYSRGTHGYIYGDCYTLERDGRYFMRSAPDYVQRSYVSEAGEQVAGMDIHNVHVVTILVPTKYALAAGGYDEGVDAWEDWTFHLRLAMRGICGHRLPMPVFTYRVYEGDRMTRFYGGDPILMERVLERYRHRQEYKHMASCCGGDVDLAKLAASAAGGAPSPEALEVSGGKVRVEFLGDERGTLTWEYAPGRSIRLGNNAIHRYADLTKEEAAWLAERAHIRIVPIFDKPDAPAPLRPIVQASDVLTPDATAIKALRPRGRVVGQRSEASV